MHIIHVQITKFTNVTSLTQHKVCIIATTTLEM